ncbi:MAG: SpoIIE family protein phosphatase [Anaerolineaceae bacterium]|nr:SpoIIE family protein phosphatase [Anaerolineaceae bacterium]
MAETTDKESSPTPQPQPAGGTPSRLRGHDPSEESPCSRWRLVDLVDVETLQKLQDGFAELCGAAVSIRDAEGTRITRPSRPNRFCTAIAEHPDIERRCRQSNQESGRQAARTGRPAKYVCHAGLTQYAATIELEDCVLGTIVLGDRPEKPFDRHEIDALAADLHVEADQLWQVAQEIIPWSDQQMKAAIDFLQLTANTITSICYQQAVLSQRIEELKVIDETTRMLASGLDLDTVLGNIVKTMAEIMKVKACSVRLLDETGKELVIKAAYNLSRDYLKKGPVLVAESSWDRAILAGQVIRIRNMATDPKVRYPAEARREGLVGSLGVGLVASGDAIGTLHIYTGRERDFTDEEVRLFRAVAGQATMVIERSRLLQERVARMQMEHELQLAAEVQKRMLPSRPPCIPGLDIHAINIPSRQVGGDFYDYIVMPEGRTGIVIADTVGKSIPAAILTASVRSALRAQAQNIFKIGQVVGRVNLMLCADSQPGEFVTLFYGVIDSVTHRMAYCNAGHDPPLLLRDGRITPLTTGGPLLGVMDTAHFTRQSIQLQPGDTLLFYTDGIIDAMDYNHQRYGRRRMTESLLTHAAEPYSAEDLAAQLLWDVRRFAGFRVRTDDLTLIVIRVNSD